MRAGVVRAEGLVVTAVAAGDKILIQQKQTSGQYLPREVAYSNFITGGGTGLTANSVVVTDASGDLAVSTALTYASSTLTANTVSIGKSGTAGALSLFSGTASKGKWLFTPVDNTGNTTMTITNAAQGGAYTYTIPDSAAAASFVMQNKGTGTEAANAVTISKLAGVITSSTLNTAGGASYLITLTNTYITSSSVVLATYNGGTNTTRNITIACVPGSGSAAITIYNNTAATALNGTVIIDFFVIP